MATDPDKRPPRAARDRQRRPVPEKRSPEVTVEVIRCDDPERYRRLVELLVGLLDERQSNTPR